MKKIFPQKTARSGAIRCSVLVAIVIAAATFPKLSHEAPLTLPVVRAGVVCNPPNEGQSGDVPFSQVKVHCDPPGPCGGLDTAYPITVSTTSASRISVTLSKQKFDEQEPPNPIGTPTPVGPWEVPAGGTTGVLGCSGELDLRDINNPRAYRYQYRLTEAHKVQVVNGGYSCPQINSNVAQCGTYSVWPGTFEPQSAAFLLAQRDNGVWTVPQNSPICIDRHAPNYDRFQQAQCFSTNANFFTFEDPDVAGCYKMTDMKGSLIHPEIKNDNAGKLQSSNKGDIYGGNCASNIDAVHWQLISLSGDPDGYFLIKNKLTGGCIEALRQDGVNRVEGEVSVQQCSPSMLQQRWKLKRVN